MNIRYVIRNGEKVLQMLNDVLDPFANPTGPQAEAEWVDVPMADESAA